MLLRKPGRRGHKLYELIHKKYPEKANIYRQKAGQWLPETRNRGMGRDCLIGTEFNFFWGNGKF